MSEGLKGGEGKAWGHEDQLNSDCTTGDRTINNPNHPVLQPMRDKHCTVCALTGAKSVQLIFVLLERLWFCSVLSALMRFLFGHVKNIFVNKWHVE